MSTFKPLEDRVLVKKLEEDNQTESGLYIPATHEKPLEKGVVVDVGPGRLLQDGTLVTRDLNPGDVVLYQKTVTLPIDVGGQSYKLLEGFDVLGVIHE